MENNLMTVRNRQRLRLRLAGTTGAGDAHANYRWLSSIYNMKVIPADPAKRLKAMDDNTLKYTLRGYGLSEKELSFAASRLKSLKSAINKSKKQIQEGLRCQSWLALWCRTRP